MKTELLSPVLRANVFQSMAEASMCWKPLPDKQVFDSTQAVKIGTKLCSEIEKELKNRKCPDCGSPKRNKTPKKIK